MQHQVLYNSLLSQFSFTTLIYKVTLVLSYQLLLFTLFLLLSVTQFLLHSFIAALRFQFTTVSSYSAASSFAMRFILGLPFYTALGYSITVGYIFLDSLILWMLFLLRLDLLGSLCKALALVVTVAPLLVSLIKRGFNHLHRIHLLISTYAPFAKGN